VIWIDCPSATICFSPHPCRSPGVARRSGWSDRWFFKADRSFPGADRRFDRLDR